MTGKQKVWTLVAASLLAATDASAVTLGRVRGAALIGRPVNVAVPVTLEAGEQDACLQADVYQGETRMGGISLRMEGSGPNQQVRILSTNVLEEPTLTLYLRVGCAQQVTRRYVLLAEHPEEAPSAPVAAPARPAASMQVPAAPAAAPAPAPVPAAAARPAPGPRASRAPAAAPTEAQTRARAADVPAVPPAALAPAPALAAAPPPDRSPRVPKKRLSPREEAAAALQARLKVDLLDVTVDASPNLRPSATMVSKEGTPAQRAEAAALWQALNTPPEQLIRQTQRIDAMEREVKSLRDAVRQNNSTMGTVAEQLQKARSERNWVTLIMIVLAAMLLAALGALFWRRRPAPVDDDDEPVRKWWQRSPQREESSFPPDATPSQQTHPRTVARDSQVDVDVSGYDRLPPDESVRVRSEEEPPPSRPPQNDFLASQPASMRMVKAEELIDIQQQAEFFVSIGQVEQALAVLEAHVHDHVETSAIAWMDLLEMYHGLGRADDFARIRAEFMALFNVQVPEFEGYRSEARGLQDYRRALSRIVALWPSPRVLDVIEESLFRKPGTPGAEAFDVEAYRDLLLLYNIARDISHDGAHTAGTTADEDEDDDHPAGPAGRQTGFASTDITPLSALVAESRWAESVMPAFEMPASVIPPDSPNIGVDIDLEALPPPEAEPEPAALNFDFEELPPSVKKKRRGSPPH